MYRWIVVLQEVVLHRGQALVTTDVCNYDNARQRVGAALGVWACSCVKRPENEIAAVLLLITGF